MSLFARASFKVGEHLNHHQPHDLWAHKETWLRLNVLELSDLLIWYRTSASDSRFLEYK